MSQDEDQNSFSIKPSQEDIDFRQRASGYSKNSSSSLTQTPLEDNRISGLGMLSATLVFLLIAAAGIFWLLNESQQNHERMQLEISRLSKSLMQFEQRLNNTGQTANSSLTALQASLDIQESETRKLWDVANKRNKAWIKELQGSIQNKHTQIKKLQVTQTQLLKNQGQVKQLNKTLNKQIGRLMKNVNQSKALTSSNLKRINTIKEDVKHLTMSMSDLPRDLKSKIEQIEESIAAIDQTRIKQARNITELGEEIKRLKANVLPNTAANKGILVP